MTDQPKTGKRIQVYLAADLIEHWEQTPRYERSKILAAALREYWGLAEPTPTTRGDDAERTRGSELD